MENEFRINQEDISNLIAEKKIENITQIFDWIEREISNGITIKYYSSYLISDNFPTKEFASMDAEYLKWKDGLISQRKALLDRINNIKSGKQ